jgi:hypothetical protein
MVLIGVLKGNGSGFIKPVTRLVTPVCTSWFVFVVHIKGRVKWDPRFASVMVCLSL